MPVDARGLVDGLIAWDGLGPTRVNEALQTWAREGASPAELKAWLKAARRRGLGDVLASLIAHAEAATGGSRATAQIVGTGDPDLVAGLARSLAHDALDHSPAWQAARSGNAGFLDELGRSGNPAALASLSRPVAWTGETPALAAAGAGHEGAVRALGRIGRDRALAGDTAILDSLAAPDAVGRTCAMAAAVAGHAGVVRALAELDHAGVRASLAASGAGGMTPLHEAAARGHAGVAEALCRAVGEGGNEAVRAAMARPNAAGETPSQMAVRLGHVAVAAVLNAAAAGGGAHYQGILAGAGSAARADAAARGPSP